MGLFNLWPHRLTSCAHPIKEARTSERSEKKVKPNGHTVEDQLPERVGIALGAVRSIHIAGFRPKDLAGQK